MEKLTEYEPLTGIQVLILDADGVIINSERITTHLDRDFGVSKDVSKAFFEGEFQNCLIGQSDLLDLLPKHLRQWGLSITSREFLDYWLKAENSINEPLKNYIEELRKNGTRCYIATNQERHRVEYMSHNMGFSTLFDGIYSSHQLKVKKPENEFYARMFADFGGIQKSEVLFWDDTIANVNSAIQFGIKSEHYQSFHDFKERMKAYDL